MPRLTTSLFYDNLRLVDADKLRRLVRMGAYEGYTGGLASGKLQANVVIVPSRFAGDFHQFCVRNPKACPLVGVSRAGSPLIPTLGNIDIRTDAPSTTSIVMVSSPVAGRISSTCGGMTLRHLRSAACLPSKRQWSKKA
ncbi:hypothetical protein [Mesorhizobium sp. M1D.F.Ca.ET.043.01.1.1]|uniref:hypothetical protein n=1 Tax=Mesorhizobium sp. M1D.F.Ca.ET.043.01.1.1 TaxID=2493669 RepID=UPI001FE1AC4B|nr:hypothetical protein [Mesorhizobium sp. M1D.F.Ca.ET.043.01.1.1]